MQMSIVSSNGILVNSASTSNEPITNEASCSSISLLNVNELTMLYGLLTMGAKMGIKNLAKLYEAVPIADKIGLNLGMPRTNFLWIFPSP